MGRYLFHCIDGIFHGNRIVSAKRGVLFLLSGILSGAEIVVECLKEQGVDTVFGYPGGAILNIYDALYQHQDEITHISRPIVCISHFP